MRPLTKGPREAKSENNHSICKERFYYNPSFWKIGIRMACLYESMLTNGTLFFHLSICRKFAYGGKEGWYKYGPFKAGENPTPSPRDIGPPPAIVRGKVINSFPLYFTPHILHNCPTSQNEGGYRPMRRRRVLLESGHRICKFSNESESVLILYLQWQPLERLEIKAAIISNIGKLANSMAYRTRRFNAAFTKGSPVIPILSQINKIPRIDTLRFLPFRETMLTIMPVARSNLETCFIYLLDRVIDLSDY